MLEREVGDETGPRALLWTRPGWLVGGSEGRGRGAGGGHGLIQGCWGPGSVLAQLLGRAVTWLKSLVLCEHISASVPVTPRRCAGVRRPGF